MTEPGQKVQDIPAPNPPLAPAQAGQQAQQQQQDHHTLLQLLLLHMSHLHTPQLHNKDSK